MGNEVIPSISLQLAPSAHVTEEMRREVLEAVSNAGLAFTGWVPLEREADPTKWRRVAQPTLRLIVTWSGGQGSHSELTSKVGDALARIRASLPALPVSINIVVDGTVRRFSFRPSDSPEAIRRGASAVWEVLGGDAGAHGWDDDARRWVNL
jgi:hypothetical protein